jgi:RNA polymerase sigma factor (sigma-70 family)
MRRKHGNSPSEIEIDWGKLKHEIPSPEEEREMVAALQTDRLRFLESCSNAWVLQGMHRLLTKPTARTHQWNGLWRIGSDRASVLRTLVREAPRHLASIDTKVTSARAEIDPLLTVNPLAADIPSNARTMEVDAASIVRMLQPKVKYLRGLVTQFSKQSHEVLKNFPNEGLIDAGETRSSLPRIAGTMTGRLSSFRSASDDVAGKYYSLVCHIAKRYQNKGMNSSDLFLEGVTGLMTALEKFEPDEGNRVSTYATWWIRQSIQTALNIGRPVHVGRSPEQKVIYETRQRLISAGIEDPTSEDIAEAAGLDTWLVRDFQRTRSVASLDKVLDEADGSNMVELLSGDAGEHERTMMIQGDMLSTLIRKAGLYPRELHVLQLRNGLGAEIMTLEEIGRIYKVTRECARLIEKRAMQKLRKAAERSQITLD